MADGREVMRRIARAGAAMDPALTDQDVDRLVAEAALRLRRRSLRRKVVSGATVSLLALGLVVFAWRRPASAPPGPAAQSLEPGGPGGGSAAPSRILHLVDGSTALPLDSATEMAVTMDTPEHVVIALARGRGRFEVKPRPRRTFVVEAGEVALSVLGTSFTVERIADRVGLTVERGRVRVDWGVGSAILGPGEGGWFPPLVLSGQGGGTASRAPSKRVAMGRPAGSSSAAFKSTEAGHTAGPAGAAWLLGAADEARMAGHPEQGVTLLKKLLRDHRGDTRAPLAAFTLGRMLLMELANPAEAAAAFAEARRLSPTGPLAEDALAREIQALGQAGARDLAQARARDYLRLYPEGRRAAAARAMVGSP